MALINRFTQLFRADLHAVLDRMEEPEQVLRQAIRDMQDQLSEAERSRALRAQEQESLSSSHVEVTEKIRELDAELDLCFANGKADLARGIVRRKLETERLAKRLAAKIAENDKALSVAQEQLREQQASLLSLKQKADICADRWTHTTPSGVDEGAWTAREMSVSEDEVDVAFLREQQARGQS